jgi:hypothetical protein
LSLTHIRIEAAWSSGADSAARLFFDNGVGLFEGETAAFALVPALTLGEPISGTTLVIYIGFIIIKTLVGSWARPKVRCPILSELTPSTLVIQVIIRVERKVY